MPVSILFDHALFRVFNNLDQDIEACSVNLLMIEIIQGSQYIDGLIKDL